MLNARYKIVMILLLSTLHINAQPALNKYDSTYLLQKIIFTSAITKGDTRYKMPNTPEGYLIQLVGSDNLSVITKSGNIFRPLNNTTVNLLFKVIRIKDSAFMEIPSTVKVEGQYHNAGINSKPFVIPSLREWHGDKGNIILTGKSRIVIDKKYAAALIKAATIFQNDISNLCKIRPVVITGAPLPGDIFISLAGNKEEFGEEGYWLSIKDVVYIKAAAYRGAFWGTRTILQLLEQVPDHRSLARGISRDYPKYEVRGFMLDVGRKYFTIDVLRDYIKMMAYYKMGDFQLHLSDNAFVRHYNSNWDSTYSGFRLQSDTYPQLPTKREFYTKKEFIDLQILAEDFAVRIIPEIDVPAHSLAISKAFPQIASKQYGSDHLDLNNPETYTIVENIFKEYLEGESPVFRNREVHIGTDEYNKKESEAFRKFTDHFIKYVQSFGKEVRVWGALTHAKGNTPVTSKGVTMNAWYNGYAEPVEMKKLGYPLISTPDGLLYIVPAAGYYYDYLDLNYLYDNWEPVTIGNITFNMGDPFVRGGMFAVWNDVAKNGITAQDVTDRVYPSIQVLGQKMWSGTDTTLRYNEFALKAVFLNEAPGLNLRGRFPGKDSLVINYAMNRTDTIIRLHNAHYITEGNSNSLYFENRNSYAELPINEIGYNYTISFSLFPSADNIADAILFQSDHAVVKLQQSNNSYIGFSREGKNYDFGREIPKDKWNRIAITGDNNSTSLYLNGELVKKLSREKISINDKNDSIWIMKTLFFPLKTIGDKNNSFIGKIKDLKVFNQMLTPAQISAIKIE